MKKIGRKVAIITDDPGWHGEQLKSSLNNYGLESSYLSLTNCSLQIAGENSTIKLPDFDTLPLGVFVRGVPGGTLEQVIFRLNILHTLNNYGIVVYNSPKAIERTVDKPYTSITLAYSGLPTPKTWICESTKQANQIVEKEWIKNNKIIQKPLFGSQGIGIHLIDQATGLIYDEKFAGVYYLQEYIERKDDNFKDIRVLEIDHIIPKMNRKYELNSSGFPHATKLSGHELLNYIKKNNFPIDRYQVLCRKCNSSKADKPRCYHQLYN